MGYSERPGRKHLTPARWLGCAFKPRRHLLVLLVVRVWTNGVLSSADVFLCSSLSTFPQLLCSGVSGELCIAVVVPLSCYDDKITPIIVIPVIHFYMHYQLRRSVADGHLYSCVVY